MEKPRSKPGICTICPMRCALHAGYLYIRPMMQICRLKGRCRSNFHSKLEPRNSHFLHQLSADDMSDRGKPKVAFLGPEASYTHQVSDSMHVQGCRSASRCCPGGFPKESTRHGTLSPSNHNRLTTTPLRATLDRGPISRTAFRKSIHSTRRNVYDPTSVNSFTNHTSRQLLTPSQQTHIHSCHKLRSRMSSLQYRTAAPTAASYHSRTAPTAL